MGCCFLYLYVSSSIHVWVSGCSEMAIWKGVRSLTHIWDLPRKSLLSLSPPPPSFLHCFPFAFHLSFLLFFICYLSSWWAAPSRTLFWTTVRVSDHLISEFHYIRFIPKIFIFTIIDFFLSLSPFPPPSSPPHLFFLLPRLLPLPLLPLLYSFFTLPTSITVHFKNHYICQILFYFTSTVTFNNSYRWKISVKFYIKFSSASKCPSSLNLF